MSADGDYVTIEQALMQAYESEQFSDITIVCQDGKITGHRSILSSASDFCKSLLQDNINSTELIFPDISATTMKHALQLLYTGRVYSSCEENWIEVLQTLTMFGIKIKDDSGLSRFEKIVPASCPSTSDFESKKVHSQQRNVKIRHTPNNSPQSKDKSRAHASSAVQSTSPPKKIRKVNVNQDPMMSNQRKVKIAATSNKATAEERRGKKSFKKHSLVDNSVFEKPGAEFLEQEEATHFQPLSIMVEQYSNSEVVLEEHCYASANQMDTSRLESEQTASNSESEVFTIPEDGIALEVEDASRDDFLEAVKQATDNDHPYTSCFAKGSKLRQKKNSDLYIARSRYDHSYSH